MDYKLEEKKYNTLNNYYKKKFKKKVFKIALNGNFTCPNIDGTISTGGCIYCSNSGSGDYGGNKNESLSKQFEQIRTMMHKKWKDAYYIVYFQANTNTYANINILKEKYETALSLHKDIVGLSIATRPDCISDELLDYLEQLNTRTFLTIELGLQTIHPETSKLINIGYDLEVATNTIKRLKKRNINTVVHIINGLPNETDEMMLSTAQYLADLKVDGIKIHMLYILRNTRLHQYYLNTKYHVLSMQEYIDIVIKQLLILPNSMIIHRITGDANKDNLIEPLWTLKKFIVMNEIDKKMRSNNLYQGKYYNKKNT